MGVTPPPATSEPTKMLMAPGQRVDVLVKAGEPGTYSLRAIPYDQGYGSPTGPVARIVVEGDPLPMKLPAALPKPTHRHITDEELTGQREVRVFRDPSREGGDGALAGVFVHDRWEDL